MKHKILLIAILLLGIFLRLYKLGTIPNSYTPDEVAQGYTAYSILNTGKDEWGSRNWLSLRSFGDYKPPIQTLLMIPSIKVFGLTPFAVRFPNAIFSIFVLFLTYLVSQQLFKNKNISLLATFLICISPHLLPMSRIALEANLTVVLTLLGFYLYLSFPALSAILFGLTFFTYHSSKIFTLFIILALVIFHKKISKIFVIVLSVFLLILFLNNQSARTGDIIITHPTDNWSGLSSDQYEITQNGSPRILTRLLNNKITYTGRIFLQNYFSYLSPQFLTTIGAGETTYGMIPGFGIIGYIASIGLIYAIYFAIKHKSNRALNLLFIILLFCPAIPALAKGSYSANRISIISPFIQIIAAYGLFTLFKNKLIKYVLIVLLVLESSYFLQTYYFRSNQILSNGMLFGHQEAINYLKQFPDQTIIYSRKLSEPQAYVAFFEKIDPALTQKDFSNIKKDFTFLDQVGEYRLKNYIFKNIDYVKDSQLPNTILVGRPNEIPEDNVDVTIFYPSATNREPAIVIHHETN